MEDISSWAGEWSDKFDQNWTEESLKEWWGKTIKVTATVIDGNGEEQRKQAICTVVGYTIDSIWIEDRRVNRFSFITDAGLQIPLFTKAQVEETSE